MIKNLFITLFGGACIASVVFAQNPTQTTWTGDAGNSFAIDGNWSNGRPLIDDGIHRHGNIGAGSLVNIREEEAFVFGLNASINQTGGTVHFSATSNLVYHEGTWTVSGGVFNIASIKRFELGGGNLVVNGGTLSKTSVGLFWINSSASTLQLTGGTHNLENLNQRAGTALLNNATLTVNRYTFTYWSADVDTTSLTLQNNSTFNVTDLIDHADFQAYDGGVTFGTGSNELNVGRLSSNFHLFNFDFLFSSTGSSISAANYTLAEWEEHWNSGRLTVNGQQDGHFSDYFLFEDNTLIFVPEPTTIAYVGLTIILLSGKAALGLRRRKLAQV